MPSVLSKILMPEWNLPYNCYELGHTWTPFCSEAACEIGLIVFIQSLKLYSPLYFGHQAIERKFDRKSTWESIRSILQSSAFLGVNSFLTILLFCYSRHLLGRFYYTLCAYVPSFFGSVLAILTERASRRRALAFYVANIASETLFRTMVARGYIRPVPNGRFLLFAGAVVGLVYLWESGLLRDPLIKFVFQLIIGCKKPRVTIPKVVVGVPSKELPDNDEHVAKPRGILAQKLDILYQDIKRHLPVLSYRHTLCPHGLSPSSAPPTGCLEDLLLNGAIKPFLIGYSGQLVLGLLPRALALQPNFLRDYLLNPRYLLSSRHAAFGLFLAAFSSVYRGARCGLRHVRGREAPALHGALAALAASPAHYIAPSTSVTLYLVWKGIEAAFSLAASRGMIPYHNWVVNCLYAAACAELFNAAVLDPKHIKPSYMRFLDRVTAHRLTYINRNVLEVFGTNSASGYEKFLPVYDLPFTTRRFQESVLVWLL